MEVDRYNKRQWIGAGELGGFGFDTGLEADGVAVLAVEDFAVEKYDGIALSVGGDVMARASMSAGLSAGNRAQRGWSSIFTVVMRVSPCYAVTGG